MKIIIVDENDNQVKTINRGENKPGDIHRVSALWVTNSQGQILMAQRALTKAWDPGSWGPAVAGTVEEGEDYHQNILKETEEEIGVKLSLSDFKKSKKELMVGVEHPYFLQWYTAIIDLPVEKFKLQKEEVEQVKWFDPEELKETIEKSPQIFAKNTPAWVSNFVK